MIRVEMRDQKIFDIFERYPFALELCHEFSKGSGPAAIHQERAVPAFDDVVVRRVVADVNNVHIDFSWRPVILLPLRSAERDVI